MSWEIRIPSPGESVNEVVIAAWLKQNGERVEKDEEILELESEKATLMVAAEMDGVLEILVAEGETVAVGGLAGSVVASGAVTQPKVLIEAEEPVAEVPGQPQVTIEQAGMPASPAARKLLEEHGLKAVSIAGSGKDGRITKSDVMDAIESAPASPPAVQATPAQEATPKLSPQPQAVSAGERNEKRTTMSSLRKKLGERLVAAKNQTAMLTTFNEADLSEVMALRKQYKELFREKHELNLGFMSFFAAAACRALVEFPAVNSRIEGDEVVEPGQVDLGIAVSAPKGLVVPVIRAAESLTLDGLESEVARLAERARENRITLDEMSGGSFTISNGGVFGSMLSTPILNPPQCAILGMHAIQRRPVAIGDNIEIRPMMYLALSYDHRLIDGRESVGFLKRIKELVEEPMRLLLNV